MRIVWFDIDSLRADHLGCYGYHRDTSPSIDALAADGMVFENCYASDAPCLPSRTALITGRFGINTGVVTHGGTAADPRVEGPRRSFQSVLATTSFARCMRNTGMRTASISSFPERHSAHHWHAGFIDSINTGMMGMETAERVTDAASDWLGRHGRSDGWFLHVNLWDPHTPYRTPESYGNPFAGDPLPDWITEEVRAAHWALPGPHSAQEICGFRPGGMWGDAFARQPVRASDMEQVRRIFDAYDTGVRYADDHIGLLLGELDALGVLEKTAIVVSADHGESLGELGVYCDHLTADEVTSRVPMVLRWPGVTARVDRALHYQIDVSATILQLLGIAVPPVWDGRGFADELRSGREAGRDALVLGQAAWCVQRSVRFDDWLWMRTYHDAFHGFPDEMLFDVSADPHLQDDRAGRERDVARRAATTLQDWVDEQVSASLAGDPFQTVLDEGGGFHIRGQQASYFERLRATGRSAWADRFEART